MLFTIQKSKKYREGESKANYRKKLLIDYKIEKKFYNRTRIGVYRFHSWLKLQHCFVIGGNP